MACVNKSSKEFKAIAAKHNISGNTLELITHKYWMQQGKEEGYPSDLYIQCQLGNIKYKEPIKEVRDLWNSRYSTPHTYSTIEELQAARTEALRFFPAQAINSHQDAKGSYVMTVRQPVSRIEGNPVADIAMNDKQASLHIDYWKTLHKEQDLLQSIINSGKYKSLLSARKRVA